MDFLPCYYYVTSHLCAPFSFCLFLFLPTLVSSLPLMNIILNLGTSRVGLNPRILSFTHQLAMNQNQLPRI